MRCEGSGHVQEKIVMTNNDGLSGVPLIRIWRLIYMSSHI
jgi:hypothetical protein